MIKRLLDVLVSLIGIILLSPLFIVVSILIRCDSRGSVFFRQARVGRNNKDFVLYKFRSMHHQDWGKDQLLTVGDNDPRITRLGRWLRQLKIDEIPQLINVLKGDMSLVGPRPLVRQQVELYPDLYLPILAVRPGITSPASIYFRHENALLGEQECPEVYFKEVIMPKKIELNLEYVKHNSFIGDVKILLRTAYLTIFDR